MKLIIAIAEDDGTIRHSSVVAEGIGEMAPPNWSFADRWIAISTLMLSSGGALTRLVASIDPKTALSDDEVKNLGLCG